MDFFTEILTPPMVFYTALLGLMVLYWMVIFIGLLDLETLDALFGFGDALEGAGEALEGVGEAAGEAAGDAAAEALAEAAGEGVADGAADSAAASFGPVESVLGFLGVGTVPVTIIGSIMVTVMWFLAFCLHHYVSPAVIHLAPPLVIALFIFLATVFGSYLATGLATRPLRRVFRVVSTHGGHNLVGRSCRIKTSCVDAEFGQAELTVKDSYLTISVRCGEQNTLHKGDEAVIIEYNPEKHVYEVREL